jgi:hypothetical protein
MNDERNCTILARERERERERECAKEVSEKE